MTTKDIKPQLMPLCPLEPINWAFNFKNVLKKKEAYRNLQFFFHGCQPKDSILHLKKNSLETGPHDVHIEFEGRNIIYHVHKNHPFGLFDMMMTYLPAYTYWFSQAGLKNTVVSVCAGEGSEFSLAQFSGSSNNPDQTLLPDAHFFQTKGMEYERELVQRCPVSWEKRSSLILWRGSPTGHGALDLAARSYINQRLRMVEKCFNINDVDAKFSINPPTSHYQDFFYNRANQHLIGQFIAPQAWQAAKYAIDIDGNSNTWTNFLRLLMFGCCVLKVDSSFGYKQWYYHKLNAYEHYVPVKADLSDLEDKIDWVRSHDRKAKVIGQNAQNFAKQLTFDSEKKYSIGSIQRHIKNAADWVN